jgi:hypothetical protein
VLTRIDRFRLFHHSEHRLVDFVCDIGLVEACDVQRWIIEQQHLCALQHEKARHIRLPRDLTVEHALVDPAHVLDSLANGKISVVQLHLQIGQARDVLGDVLEPRAENGQIIEMNHARGRSIQTAHLECIRSQLIGAVQEARDVSHHQRNAHDIDPADFGLGAQRVGAMIRIVVHAAVAVVHGDVSIEIAATAAAVVVIVVLRETPSLVGL